MIVMRSLMSIILAGLLAGLASLAVAEETQFRIEAELWIDGVQRGTPSLQVAPNTQASLETGNDDERWRLAVEVEPVDDHLAPDGTVWVHVSVHERDGEHWEHLLDSIVGVPEGEPATVSLVDGDAPATEETAAVFLRIRTTLVRD